MVPHHLTDHETRTARFCIDEGADMVVGHHHHILRGMEWYRGKPIMYGLGHFVFDLRVEFSEEMTQIMDSLKKDPDFYGTGPREGWPLLPLHEDSRMTALAWASVTDGAFDSIGFLPCMLKPDGQVYPVDPNSEEGGRVVEYVGLACSSQKLNARIENGGESLGGHVGVKIVAQE